MQQRVAPATVVIAIVVLVVVVAAIWYFTVGKKKPQTQGPAVDAGTMQPKTPEEAKAKGYFQAPPGGQGASMPGTGSAPGG